MVKYWNPARIKRIRERPERKEQRIYDEAKKERKRLLRGMPVGRDPERLLDVLGLPLRRKMLGRLQKSGAMSVSKLAEPFGLTLSAALKHVRYLEWSGIVKTKKQGRTRICSYNPGALPELARFLESRYFNHK
ncbi:MAG: helix-turn-helix transcriptional regulator [Candidatus Kaiserbacteria bacterium]|nr:MAG: helix-turn-helix transcriptional regulator [Candidatus Kaiserbacteria bacterium]